MSEGQPYKITVCNNRCWPNPVILVAVFTNEEELRDVNAAVQYLLAKDLMFKCAEWLAGRELTCDLACEYLGARLSMMRQLIEAGR